MRETGTALRDTGTRIYAYRGHWERIQGPCYTWDTGKRDRIDVKERDTGTGESVK